jgi:hypothetical protein
MDDLAKAEFDTKIAIRRKGIANCEALIAAGRAKQPIATFHLSKDWGVLGFCLAHLRRYDESRDAFMRSARIGRELLAGLNPEIFKETLHGALLWNDSETETYLRDTPIPLEKMSCAPVLFHYFRGVRALLQGNESEALAAANEAVDLDYTGAKWKTLSGLGLALKTLLEKGAESFSRALCAVLDSHIKYATRGSLRGMDEALLCIEAISLAILARRRDINVTVPNKYHAVKLTRNVTALETWNGQHVYRQKFVTEADILPETLVAISGRS